MGATFVRKHIYEAFMAVPGDFGVEFMHGYTYSGHPLACAAAIASVDVYKNEGLFENARNLETYWQDALHSLKDAPYVIDIRNQGLMGAVEIEAGTGRNPPHEMTRTMEVFDKLFFEQDMVCRFTGNVLAFSPPLILEKTHIDQIVDRVRKALGSVK